MLLKFKGGRGQVSKIVAGFLMSISAACFSCYSLAEEESLSLNDIFTLARSNDPRLAIARYRLDGASAERYCSWQILPAASLFGDWSQNKVRYEGNEYGDIPSLDYPGERYGLQLRAPLFNMRNFRDYERFDFCGKGSRRACRSRD